MKRVPQFVLFFFALNKQLLNFMLHPFDGGL